MRADSPQAPVEQMQDSSAPKPRRILRWRWRLAIGLMIVGLLGILATVGGLAVYQGLQDRAANVRRDAESHYQKGLAHLEAGEIDLAIAEFELVLRLAPDRADAQAKIVEAQQKRPAVSTPTSVVFSTVLEQMFQDAVALYDQHNWTDAASAFMYLASLSPEYRWQEVEQYQFDCYRLQGEELEAQNRFEEAIRAYDQALRVKPGSETVARDREMLSLYLAGATAAGADWAKSVAAFSQLYGIDPAYRDVKHRLYDAYIGSGDAFMGSGLWCEAKDAYASAQTLDDNPTVRGKLNDGTQRCSGAVAATQSPQPARPTAEPAIMGELPFGRIFLAQYDDKRKVYDIVLFNADGKTRQVIAQNAEQPALSPDGKRLAFRSTDKTAPGIFVLDLASGKRTALTNTSRDSRPFWPPDGTRVAFIRDATAPTAAILTVAVDGSSAPEPLADGWSGAWSGSNHLASTGCNENQECGIFIDDLSGGGMIRVTGDRNDIGLAWTPDSTQVAYMSSHDGNWEIYTVRLEGGFVRRCTVNFADDGAPAWSPDGRYMAFLSDRDGTWSLYFMLADGSEQRKVADLSTSNPNWTQAQMVWAP